MKKSPAKEQFALRAPPDYSGLLGGIAGLLETARRTSARAVNALMTATYWEIGKRIVEFEQGERSAPVTARSFFRGFPRI